MYFDNTMDGIAEAISKELAPIEALRLIRTISNTLYKHSKGYENKANRLMINRFNRIRKEAGKPEIEQHWL